jgi:hypothetical protein
VRAEHRPFVVETFFVFNSDTFVKTQRIFRKHFGSSRQGKVPCCNTIQLSGTNASADSVRAVRSLQNIEAVRQSFVWSPRCSTRRYSVALGTSDRSSSRILQKNLNFHPYKITVVQELSDRDVENLSKVAEHLIGILSDILLSL